VHKDASAAKFLASAFLMLFHAEAQSTPETELFVTPRAPNNNLSAECFSAPPDLPMIRTATE
jgi:hypothetical protein